MPSGFDICISSEGYAIRTKDGGCTSYWDAMGCVWTIGFGSTGKDIGRHTTWTRAQAVDRLQLSWQQAKAGVLRASPVLASPENANRLDAITDFAYNCGVGRYQGSSLRAYVNRQSWEQAAAEFPKWNLAGGKVRAGLVTRRAAERLLFETPVHNSGVASPLDSGKAQIPLVPSSDPAPNNFLPEASFVPSSLDAEGVLTLGMAFLRKLFG